jgi:cell division protein FtsB
MRPRPATASPLPAGTRLGRWRAVVAAVGLVALAAYLIGGDDGFYSLVDRRRELRQLEARVDTLAAQNDSLKQVLWRLENDLEYVEKVAREEYGMSRQGEHVYRLYSPQREAPADRK